MSTTAAAIPMLDEHARQKTARAGFAYALAAFIWWGFAPIYFKLIVHVPPMVVLGHRIIWSVLLLAVLVAIRKQWPQARAALRDPRARILLTVSTILIGVNWLIFIYAIFTDRIMDASLGYFINPLFTVALGMIFLGERMRRAQWIATIIAAAGIVYLTVSHSGLPWIAISLPATFAIYSLLRKQAHVGPMVGLFVETALLLPLALGYLIWAHAQADAAEYTTPGTIALLSLAGVVTTMPLLWFVAGSKRLPFITIGFMQYISPSMQFVTAVLIYNEAFDRDRMIAFALVWIAIGIFITDSLRRARFTRAAVAVPLIE